LSIAQTTDAVVPFESVLNPDALFTRSARASDLRAELSAMHTLALEMLKSPAKVMDRFVELAIELCNAESGGISLFEAQPDSPGIFRWYGLKGRFAAYLGGTTPREFSPCGAVLDLLQPIVMNYPERHYSYLGENGLTIPELLLVPLLDTHDQAIGTIWVVHDEGGHFAKNDSETLVRLAAFTSVGLMLTQAVVEKDKLLQNQTFLVREANHRISNSLQLATSILFLQARREPDEAVVKKLEDAVQRINSISRIHNRLYRTGEMATVEISQYLRDLSAEIVEAVKGQRADREYYVRVEAPEFQIPTDMATKLGIIVSELVTNAFKHCGASRSTCLVSITLKRLLSDQLIITISDDGEGLPPGFAFGSGKGLGAAILKAMTTDLGGKITIQRSDSGGASFSIELPLPKKTD
jgi:two-component sensor histidine kinase